MNYKATQPCAVCGLFQEDMVCYHHIYSRKAYPEFESSTWNKIPVCLKHHNEFHQKGRLWMYERYIGAKKWLENNGWVVEMGKLINNYEVQITEP